MVERRASSPGYILRWRQSICSIYQDKSNRLLSHYFYDDPLVPLPVKLGVKNLLPGSEVELPVGDWDDDFMMNKQRLEVRLSIVFASLMMLIILAKRSQRFEPLVDIFDQSALVVVDVDSSSNVHGGDEDHAVSNPRLLERGLDLRREVNIGALGFGVQGYVFGVEFHRSILKGIKQIISTSPKTSSPCHPERSRIMREAHDRAQPKDPYTPPKSTLPHLRETLTLDA
jgi:hypothetical protein